MTIEVEHTFLTKNNELINVKCIIPKYRINSDNSKVLEAAELYTSNLPRRYV